MATRSPLAIPQLRRAAATPPTPPEKVSEETGSQPSSPLHNITLGCRRSTTAKKTSQSVRKLIQNRMYQTPTAFDRPHLHCYDSNAGWSSLVARWAHNPKVGGSNPPPATNAPRFPSCKSPGFLKLRVEPCAS